MVTDPNRVYLDIPRFFSLPLPWMRALNWWGRLEGDVNACVYSLPAVVYESMMGRGNPEFLRRCQ